MKGIRTQADRQAEVRSGEARSGEARLEVQREEAIRRFEWVHLQHVDRVAGAVREAVSAPQRPGRSFMLRGRMYGEQDLGWYLSGLALDPLFTYLLLTTDPAEVEALPDGLTQNVVNLKKINDARYVNKFFEAVSRKLPEGGLLIGCAVTLEERQRWIAGRYPRWIAGLHEALLFWFKRVFPKLKLTRRLYFALTKGRDRVISTAEVLGRLTSCGFDVVDYREFENRLYYTARKARPPAYDLAPSYGPVFKMRRVGQYGRIIEVYKFRTMHPYAEYLQAYLYERNRLHQSGKFQNDFRITAWGRFMRKVWLDELPMLINWAKGEVKLVGVRPLSEQYFSLYPPELQERRQRFKPGLIPPYYADMPGSFEEILQSESAYFEAYEQSPWRTDLRYGCRALFNIFFRKARSR